MGKRPTCSIPAVAYEILCHVDAVASTHPKAGVNGVLYLAWGFINAIPTLLDTSGYPHFRKPPNSARQKLVSHQKDDLRLVVNIAAHGILTDM